MFVCDISIYEILFHFPQGIPGNWMATSANQPALAQCKILREGPKTSHMTVAAGAEHF